MSIFQASKGFAALYLVVVLLIIVIGIALAITFTTLQRQRDTYSAFYSDMAYYAAEAGIEDALIRFENGMVWTSPYMLLVGDASVTVTIGDLLAGARTFTAVGEMNSHIRTVQVVYELSGDGVGFFYGAQVGVGGVQMEKNTRYGNRWGCICRQMRKFRYYGSAVCTKPIRVWPICTSSSSGSHSFADFRFPNYGLENAGGRRGSNGWGSNVFKRNHNAWPEKNSGKSHRTEYCATCCERKLMGNGEYHHKEQCESKVS